MDVLAVREACRWAKNYALEHGPLVIELLTYRYGGHSMSDPGTTYRTREEIQYMRSNNDPITGLKDRIVHAGMATEEELKEIEKLCRKFVDEAVEVAKAGKQPDVKELWTDIYTPGSEPKFIRGRTSFEGKSF